MSSIVELISIKEKKPIDETKGVKGTHAIIERQSLQLQTKRLQVSILSSNTPSKRTKKKKVQSPISFQAKHVMLEEDIDIPN